FDNFIRIKTNIFLYKHMNYYTAHQPPDIMVYERFAHLRLDFHIITERLLPSTSFYYLVGLCTSFCFLIFIIASI
ncbi:MAG: hypothetical protein ACFFB5_20415, partial [Promethearchaeota archaeon]